MLLFIVRYFFGILNKDIAYCVETYIFVSQIQKNVKMTIKNYLIFALLLSASLCFGQVTNKEEIPPMPPPIEMPLVVEPKDQTPNLTEDGIHDYVENPPSFEGGEEDVLEYISDNLEFPYEAKQNDISGRVITSFVVEKDGSLSNIRIIKDIGGGCGKEAIRLLEEMPKWNPALQNGHLVRCRYTLPIRFRL
jgi:TonB family protein